MSFLKRFFKFILVVVVISIPFNYFFAHLAFHNVLNKFVQSQLPTGQQLVFTSSFHFYPETFIRFKDVDYKDAKDNHLSIIQFDAILDFWTLIKTKKLVVSSFTVSDVQLNLSMKNFDELIRSVMFPLIREGLGVPRDPAIVFPSKFSMTNIHLHRMVTNQKSEPFVIAKVTYNTNSKNFMSMCFAKENNALDFYNQFIKQFLFAAQLDKKCIAFKKTLKEIKIPNLTVPKDQ